jgi:hypothetical protein
VHALSSKWIMSMIIHGFWIISFSLVTSIPGFCGALFSWALANNIAYGSSQPFINCCIFRKCNTLPEVDSVESIATSCTRWANPTVSWRLGYLRCCTSQGKKSR